VLRLSLVAIPVRAYPAVASAATPRFNQLHADCGQRIRYEKRCPQHGPVESDAIVQGFPCGPNQYVIVEADELERFRPTADKALVVEQCVPVSQVEPTFLAGRTLYLVPDGLAAQHPYRVLATALATGQLGALARVVLGGHRQLVLVRPLGRLLALDVLHYPAQVRATASWDVELPDTAISTEEMQLASQLVSASTGPTDWGRYRDTNAEELAALLQAKAAGQLPTSAPEPATPMQPLLEALRQSVAAAVCPASHPSLARKPHARRGTKP
jgi:DNA end-binding protein Ku